MPGARERPQTTGASPSLSLRAHSVLGEILQQMCLLNTEASKGPGVSSPHTGVSFQIVSQERDWISVSSPSGMGVATTIPQKWQLNPVKGHLSDTPPCSQDTLCSSLSTPSNKKAFLHLLCGPWHSFHWDFGGGEVWAIRSAETWIQIWKGHLGLSSCNFLSYKREYWGPG